METLYDKIGAERLRRLVDTFYKHIYASPIRHLFTNDQEVIATKQLAFLTQFLGGPQLYSEAYGHPRMRARHLPHPIDQFAKTTWLDCMQMAIEEVFKEDPELGRDLMQVFPRVAEHMVNR